MLKGSITTLYLMVCIILLESHQVHRHHLKTRGCLGWVLASSVWNKQYLINTDSEIHGKLHLNGHCWETSSKPITEVLELQLNLARLRENAFYLQIIFPPSPWPFTDFCSIVYLWKVTAFLHGTKEELFFFTMRALCFTWKYQQGKRKIMGFVILFILGTLISFQRKISFAWGTNPIGSQ